MVVSIGAEQWDVRRWRTEQAALARGDRDDAFVAALVLHL